jgi:hypothetical protein
MTDRIRIIPHFPKGIPDCGSFEVWFADGPESGMVLLGRRSRPTIHHPFAQ